MKKITAIFLATLMLMLIVSCDNGNRERDTSATDSSEESSTLGGTSDNPGGTTDDSEDTSANPGDTTDDSEETTKDPEETTAGSSGGEITPVVDGSTLGGKLWESFVNAYNSNPSATTEELARTVSSTPELQCDVMVTSAEPGYLMGFGNAEVRGFNSCHAFYPIIGPTPIVGYVFKLDANADVAAFIKYLTDNANPNWNICTTADQTVVGACGNYVFFTMCGRG